MTYVCYANISTQIIYKKEAKYHTAGQFIVVEYCLMGMAPSEYPSERRAGFFTL